MILGTAIYCTRVDEMSDVVALLKPKFTSRRGAWRVPPSHGWLFRWSSCEQRVAQRAGLRSVAVCRAAAWGSADRWTRESRWIIAVVTTKREQKDDARLQQQIMIVAYGVWVSRRHFVPPAQSTSGNTPGGARVAKQRGALRGSDVDNSISAHVALSVPLHGW